MFSHRIEVSVLVGEYSNVPKFSAFIGPVSMNTFMYFQVVLLNGHYIFIIYLRFCFMKCRGVM